MRRMDNNIIGKVYLSSIQHENLTSIIRLLPIHVNLIPVPNQPKKNQVASKKYTTSKYLCWMNRRYASIVRPNIKDISTKDKPRNGWMQTWPRGGKWMISWELLIHPPFHPTALTWVN
jgi:hypothetical protein